MKKLLEIIVLGLLLSGNAYAKIFNSIVEKAYVCNSGECKTIKSEKSFK